MGENARQKGLEPKWPRIHIITSSCYRHLPLRHASRPPAILARMPQCYARNPTAAIFPFGAKPTVPRPEGCSSAKSPLPLEQPPRALPPLETRGKRGSPHPRGVATVGKLRAGRSWMCSVESSCRRPARQVTYGVVTARITECGSMAPAVQLGRSSTCDLISSACSRFGPETL